MPAVFVADENIPALIIAALRALGFEVISISETRPRLPDDAVLAEAFSRGAVLLTADKDFGELVFQHHQNVSGVILLRLHGLTPEARRDLVVEQVGIHGERLQGAFTVISPGQVRIRPR